MEKKVKQKAWSQVCVWLMICQIKMVSLDKKIAMLPTKIPTK